MGDLLITTTGYEPDDSRTVEHPHELIAAEAWMGMLCPWLLCGLCTPDDVHAAADGCLN